VLPMGALPLRAEESTVNVVTLFSPLVLGVLFGLPIVILILAFTIIFKSKIFNRLAPKGKRVEETTL
ncbi:MAG: hypothetical protein ACP5M7_01485, partial [Thermoproteota archaeon]